MTQVWFEEETDYFDIEVTMQVETLRRNVPGLPANGNRAIVAIPVYLSCFANRAEDIIQRLRTGSR